MSGHIDSVKSMLPGEAEHAGGDAHAAEWGFSDFKKMAGDHLKKQMNDFKKEAKDTVNEEVENAKKDAKKEMTKVKKDAK